MLEISEIHQKSWQTTLEKNSFQTTNRETVWGDCAPCRDVANGEDAAPVFLSYPSIYFKFLSQVILYNSVQK